MATTTVRDNKDSNAKLDYIFTWQDWLGSAIIASARVFDVSSTLVIGIPTIASTSVTVVIEGGTEGKTHPVINRITTDTGLIEDKVLQLTITDSPSVSHTFIPEDGSSKTNSNSYATVADGDSYHSSHLFATAWHQVDDWTKEKALMWATRLMDENIDWNGNKTDQDQALQWPRIGTYDRDGWVIDNNEMPKALKDATAEFARYLIGEDRTALSETDDMGFSKIKAGSLELEINAADRKGIIPPHVFRMVSFIGDPAYGGQPTIGRM